MGWTTYRKTHKTIKEFFEQQWNQEDAEFKKTVLEAAQVGFTEAYAAIEFLNKKTGEREVFAATYLIHYNKGYDYNFGYKDMTEHCGPGMYKCPEKIMKLLTPLPETNEEGGVKWATEWRAANWLRINEAKAQRKKGPQFKVGDTVVFRKPIKFTNGTTHSQLKVAKTKPLRFTDGTSTFFGPSLLTIRKSTVNYLLDKIIPAGIPVESEPQVPDLTLTGYPKYVDPWSNEEHTCIRWAVGPNGWEWYLLEIVDKKNHIYYSFVHGDADEFGDVSAKELLDNGIQLVVDPKKLQEIMPPVGWKKVA